MTLRLLTSLSWVAQGALASTTTLSHWNVISSANTGDDPTKLSQSGLNTSSWYTIGSAATLMTTLIGNTVYNETEIFYSTNLQKIDTTQFRVPWYYRTDQIVISEKKPEDYYILITHGISSRADIWLNGRLVADKETQAGSYGGLEYDITDKLKPEGVSNVLLVKAYPTDYNRDLAIGFVDWNPSPPDNGTGIWRPFELKRTGQVRLSTPRITAHAALDGGLDVFVDLKNLAKNRIAEGDVTCAIFDPKRTVVSNATSHFQLTDNQQSTVSLRAKVENPQLWWPFQWGDQPLYSVQCNVSTSASTLSDSTPTTKFGIRTVTSSLNTRFNDTTFFVNGQRFQVLGAGYTSDIFLRFDPEQVERQFQLVKDMGLNTVRLEGKQERPELYEIADRMGIMVLAGWECCDKWEGWDYNEDGSGEKWKDSDYKIAELSMRHEAEMMRHHPSMLGFLVGSDYWPNDRATKVYVDALNATNWDIPIIASASQRGAPDLLGNGGMKMEGPYDWVPPNYWYDPEHRLGSAAGFGSELGAGVGTPEFNSLRKFLSALDLEDLWKQPNKGLYHMSTDVSSFHTREIYNTALWARYGAPSSLSDYLIKAQMMDYEATRAQLDAWVSNWGEAAERPATGMIYWMLNNAWPSLHWNLFDYYLRPAGSYFGTKDTLGTFETLTLNYESQAVYLVNRHLARTTNSSNQLRTVGLEIMTLNGSFIARQNTNVMTKYNSAYEVMKLPAWQNKTQDSVVLARLLLYRANQPLVKKTYWLARTNDVLDWDNSTWYHTPVTSFSNYTALERLSKTDITVVVAPGQGLLARLTLKNKGAVPAVFVRLNVMDQEGRDVAPLLWSKNYITLWPGEEEMVEVALGKGVQLRDKEARVVVDGRNVEEQVVLLGV